MRAGGLPPAAARFSKKVDLQIGDSDAPFKRVKLAAFSMGERQTLSKRQLHAFLSSIRQLNKDPTSGRKLPLAVQDGERFLLEFDVRLGELFLWVVLFFISTWASFFILTWATFS